MGVPLQLCADHSEHCFVYDLLDETKTAIPSAAVGFKKLAASGVEMLNSQKECPTVKPTHHKPPKELLPSRKGCSVFDVYNGGSIASKKRRHFWIKIDARRTFWVCPRSGRGGTRFPGRNGA